MKPLKPHEGKDIMDAESPAIFTRRKLAERWHTSEDTVDRLRARGELKFIQISPRRVGCAASDVHDYEERNKS
jgi:hypothetical protein